MKYQIELIKRITFRKQIKVIILDSRIVEAETPEIAKDKAFMTFKKIDRKHYDEMRVVCLEQKKKN